MTLDEYRIREGLSYRKLATKLGLDYTTVFKYCSGDRVPLIDKAVQIQEKTDGEVSVSSWQRKK